jgi:hypothetical protein
MEFEKCTNFFEKFYGTRWGVGEERTLISKPCPSRAAERYLMKIEKQSITRKGGGS